MIEVREVKVVSGAIVDALNHLVPQLSSSALELQPSQVARLVDDPDVHLLIAAEVETERVMGTLTLVVFAIPSGQRAWIEDVIVEKDARGTGIGKMLVNNAIARAKELGVKTVDLTSRPSRVEANALYLSLGFHARETNVYRFDID